ASPPTPNLPPPKGLPNVRQRPGAGPSYLQGPGTGITSLPSFSATRLVVVELPDESPSFALTCTTSFLVGFSGMQTFFPSGESCGPEALAASSGLSGSSSIFAILLPASADIIIWKKPTMFGSAPVV